MQVEEIPGKDEGEPPILVITGFGAHRTLADECGLHILEIAEAENGGNRATARVRLTVTPLGDLPHRQDAERHHPGIRAGPRPNAVVRRYRGDPRRWCAMPTAAGAAEDSMPCCAAISICWRQRREAPQAGLADDG